MTRTGDPGGRFGEAFWILGNVDTELARLNDRKEVHGEEVHGDERSEPSGRPDLVGRCVGESERLVCTPKRTRVMAAPSLALVDDRLGPRLPRPGKMEWSVVCSLPGR